MMTSPFLVISVRDVSGHSGDGKLQKRTKTRPFLMLMFAFYLNEQLKVSEQKHRNNKLN